MERADYARIAGTYDISRRISDHNLDLCLGKIAELVEPDDRYILDLGCGTGRIAIPAASCFDCRILGADKSIEMINQAKRKAGERLVQWQVADAQFLPYSQEAIDVAFMSHLLHHVDDPLKVIKECHRVLRKGGKIVIRYGALESVLNDPIHRFFPETCQIDQRRGHSIKKTEDWLNASGFREIRSETLEQKTYESARQFLESVRLKGTSALTLISLHDFDRGLRKLEKYVKWHPDDPWLIRDQMSYTRGLK